ncbi:hypothetical protein H6504_00465 [Candidatus Woesearchaeota archaeon]|nr:hypothetical protein [Candidatus Woesearchaeota archaeon]
MESKELKQKVENICITAEFILQNLQNNNEHDYDYSPVLMEISKAVECVTQEICKEQEEYLKNNLGELGSKNIVVNRVSFYYNGRWNKYNDYNMYDKTRYAKGNIFRNKTVGTHLSAFCNYGVEGGNLNYYNTLVFLIGNLKKKLNLMNLEQIKEIFFLTNDRNIAAHTGTTEKKIAEEWYEKILDEHKGILRSLREIQESL